MKKRLLFSICVLFFQVSAQDAISVVDSSGSHKQLFTRSAGFWSKPEDESKIDFFSKLTEPKSQRENWYKVSPYVAEFWCAASNIGFIYVGLKQRSPELLFAGIASAVSHTIPKQWLLLVDKLGVAVVASKIVREHKVVYNNPILVLPALLAASINASDAYLVAASINASDAYLARNKGQTWPHVVWHLSSAFLANEFLKRTK